MMWEIMVVQLVKVILLVSIIGLISIPLVSPGRQVGWKIAWVIRLSGLFRIIELVRLMVIVQVIRVVGLVVVVRLVGGLSDWFGR